MGSTQLVFAAFGAVSAEHCKQHTALPIVASARTAGRTRPCRNDLCGTFNGWTVDELEVWVK